MVVNALTHKGANIENCLRTPVKIANPSNAQTIESLGIWDTGATNSVITKAVARNLGLKPVQYAKVRGVHGEKTVPVYFVSITLNNENITLKTLVSECEELSDNNDTGMLIGMNIINTGDFCITNFDNKTVLTFRTPSLTKIDYVEEIAEHNKYLRVYQIQHQHGNDRCPCGSNKLYKNCHGHSIYNK